MMKRPIDLGQLKVLLLQLPYNLRRSLWLINNNALLTGVERTFSKDSIIVSKTNLKGHVTYGNQLFFDLAGYPEKQIIGAPHSIIRHPDMPRC
jgi:hypothetical protein